MSEASFPQKKFLLAYQTMLSYVTKGWFLMLFSWSPLKKRSFLTNIPAIAVLGVTLAACGGGSTPAASTTSSCTPGSNTQLVKITSPIKKVAWSQNALDGAWRFAEEGSI